MLILMLTFSSQLAFAQESIQPLALVNKIYYKAVQLYERKNWQAAKESFQDFLAVADQTPLFVPSMYYLAYCYQQLNDPQKSANLYNRVISESTPDEAFWSQMAQKRLQEVKTPINIFN